MLAINRSTRRSGMPDSSPMSAVAGGSVLVRPARPADLPDVGRIAVEAYHAAGQLEPGSPYRETLADADARYREATILVAELNGVVVGSVTVCQHGSPFHEIARADELEFRFLSVDPSKWGRGIAQALVDACDRLARDQQCSRLAICVRDNNVGAAAMYEGMGFERDEQRDWSPREGVDLLALTRPV
jgi:ribosomal protein S18 acetylase RimI-like enzyme